MIRATLIKSIHDVLKSHLYLSLEDFNIREYTSSTSNLCVEISYRYNDNWFFKSTIPTKKTKLNSDSSYLTYNFNCTMSPGQESSEESTYAEERKGFLEEISLWINRIYEDIVSAPIVRQLEAHASLISELQERLKKVPDEPLTENDISDFRENLNKIKEEFSQQLKQFNDDKVELKKQLDELSRDIDFLKASLPSMSKQQWGKLLFVRIKKWKENFSIKKISAGIRVIKLLLPPDADVSDELEILANTADNIADIIDNKKE